MHKGVLFYGTGIFICSFSGKNNTGRRTGLFRHQRDGFHWEAVNDGAPVLWTYYGDKGVRDFTITHSIETGKYYIFATDLSLSYGMRNQYHNSWDEIGRNGSKYFSVWESEDLVNWSDQRLVKIGDDDFGCLWAPDLIYDKENGEYVLHWSSSHAANDYGPKKSITAQRRILFIFQLRRFCTKKRTAA